MIPQSTGVLLLHPNTFFINESGLYDVFSKSLKPRKLMMLFKI